jgi:pimeloyl-ACP methyl ester carboxylesterase
MLHGYLSDSSYWYDSINELSKDHQIILVDLLGFGKSPKPFLCSYSIEIQINKLHELISFLKIESFKIVGHSMGAIIALKYSLAFPEGIQEALLLNMPIFNNKVEAKAQLKKTFSGLYGILLFTPLGILGWPIFKKILKKPGKNKNVNNFIMASSKNSYTSRLKSLKLIENSGTLCMLEKIDIPTKLFEGLYDKFFSTKIIIANKKVTLFVLSTGHNSFKTDKNLIKEIIQ